MWKVYNVNYDGLNHIKPLISARATDPTQATPPTQLFNHKKEDNLSTFKDLKSSQEWGEWLRKHSEHGQIV
jgi:hypothetical protein